MIPDPTEALDDEDDGLEAAGPPGPPPRERPCHGCRRPMTSTGPAHRHCRRCLDRMKGLSPRAAAARREAGGDDEPPRDDVEAYLDAGG